MVLNPNYSIFSAELIAILLFLRAVLVISSTRCVIVSDSLSAKAAISNPRFDNPVISKICTC